jgi:lipopolysaccharide/colanic/teichoic acid biosynthesis glycosyltransferase
VRVLPGITGMWQISGRNHTSFATRTAFDVRYVMNWSVWVDVYIMVRTVWVLFRRDGAN